MPHKMKTAPLGNEAENTSKEIVTQNNQVVNYSTEQLIARAIDQKVDVGTMERLLAMAEKMQTIKAKQEFDKAMAEFQSACPAIKKDKEVKDNSGRVLYSYAPIDSIISQVKGLLQQYGFSYSTNMELLENGVKVFVKVTHIMGHSEVTEMNVPLGTKTGIMSASQQVAAAQTFAKRYAFLNAFGIMTGDEDNDGANVAQEGETTPKSQNFAPSEKQIALIKQLMEQKGITEEQLIDEGFSSLKDLTGGKEGTASELIENLFKISKFSNGLQGPSEEDKFINVFIKDLEACTTPVEYEFVTTNIKRAKNEGKLSTNGYNVLLKVCKEIVKKFQP